MRVAAASAEADVRAARMRGDAGKVTRRRPFGCDLDHGNSRAGGRRDGLRIEGEIKYQAGAGRHGGLALM